LPSCSPWSPFGKWWSIAGPSLSSRKSKADVRCPRREQPRHCHSVPRWWMKGAGRH